MFITMPPDSALCDGYSALSETIADDVYHLFQDVYEGDNLAVIGAMLHYVSLELQRQTGLRRRKRRLNGQPVKYWCEIVDHARFTAWAMGL